MYFSRIIIASIIGVASIKTTLVAAEDVCAATDEQGLAYFGNIVGAMASMSPECQGEDELVMTPECITEALSIMDTACDATDGMAILAVESEVDCGDLDTDDLDVMLPQNGKACVPDACTMDSYQTYIKAETDGECSFGAPNACALSSEQTLTVSIEAFSNLDDLASECLVEGDLVESDKCEKAGTEAIVKVCTATDGLKVAKFGDLTCPDSVELDLGLSEPGPDGQVCVPTACKEAGYVDYLSDNIPEECTFSTFSASSDSPSSMPSDSPSSSAGFSARSSAMLVTSTVLAAALALLM